MRAWFLRLLIVCAVVGAATGAVVVCQKATNAPAVSDSLKFKVERWRREATEFQIVVTQIERRRAELQQQGQALQQELRTALGAKDSDEIDLNTFVIKSKPVTPQTPPK